MALSLLALLSGLVFLQNKKDSKDKKKDRQPKFVIHASGVMPREKQTTIMIQNIGEDAFLTNVRVKTEEFKCLTGLNEFRVQKEDDFTLTFEHLGQGNRALPHYLGLCPRLGHVREAAGREPVADERHLS